MTDEMKIKLGRLLCAMAAVLLPIGWISGIVIATENENTTWLCILIIPFFAAAIASLIGMVYRLFESTSELKRLERELEELNDKDNEKE